MWPLCAALWKNFVSFLSMDHICKLSVSFCWKTGLVSISLLTHLSLDGLVGVNFIFWAMTQCHIMLLLTLHQLWHLGALPAPTAMFSASPTPVSTLLLPSRFISCTSCLNFSTRLCLLSWRIPLDTTIWVLDAGIPTGCQVNQRASGHLCLTQLSTCGSDVCCSRPPRQTLQPLPLLPPAMKNLVPPALCPADSEF